MVALLIITGVLKWHLQERPFCIDEKKLFVPQSDGTKYLTDYRTAWHTTLHSSNAQQPADEL